MSLKESIRKIVFDFFKLFIKKELIVDILTSITMILFWVLLAYLVTSFVRLLIMQTKSLEERLDKKETLEEKTIKRLINNVIKFFFIFWILIMILSELGLDLIPLLAGAGVLAFAVGFGAQELIKDVISGMFLILEKTFKIGDYVEIGSSSGTVTDVGLRRIKLKNWKGEVITINNGDIKTIKNLSLNPSYAVIEFKTNYDFDLKEFISKDFKEFLKNFKESHEDIIEMPSNVILVDMTDGLKFNIHIKTNNRKHVGVERAFRRDLIGYFNSKNLNIKLPITVESYDK